MILPEDDVAAVARAQALRAANLLNRWLDDYEARAAASEAPPDLKEFGLYAAALERTLKIARLADVLRSDAVADGDASHPLAADALRALLFEDG